MRSRSAAGMLSGEGFNQVYTMTGGMDTWNGLRASGAPEAGMAAFSETHTAEELVALAYILEEGSRKFYDGVAKSLDDTEASQLFETLVSAEEQHKAKLLKIHQDLLQSESGSEMPVLENSEGLMEGGINVNEALSWARDKGVRELLQFSISLETNAYDLYLKMMGRIKDPEAVRIFEILAREEKTHLERMVELFERRT